PPYPASDAASGPPTAKTSSTRSGDASRGASRARGSLLPGLADCSEPLTAGSLGESPAAPRGTPRASPLPSPLIQALRAAPLAAAAKTAAVASPRSDANEASSAATRGGR